MDIVTRVWRRYAMKMAAYTTNPRKVEPQFKVLEDSLHFLAAGVGTGDDPMQGYMFQSYSMAIDAYREIMYYLRKMGGMGDESKTHNLASMSKHPFAPDEVIEHNPHVFAKAMAEVNLLRQEFNSAAQPQMGAAPHI